MARPPVSDWDVLDLTEDPTPGNPEVLKELVRQYQIVSDDAESAAAVINRIEGGDFGAGKAMTKLKDVLEDLPGQVGALRDSYEGAAQAISVYIPLLVDHQQKADLALANGKEAKTALDAANASASSAEANLSTAKGAEKPDDNAVQQATTAVSSAKSAVSDAEADLEAARRLALDARDLRETDARTASTALGAAEDKAVKEKNFWDKLWDTIGSVFGIISAVLGVISFIIGFIPGLQPLALALGAASLVFGLVPLGINIARGVVTGDWDIAGIVLGVVGTAFGGFSLIKSIGGILKGAKGAGSGVGSVTDDLDSIPPRPSNPTPGSSFSDDLDLPIQRPGSSSGSSTGSASDDLDLPIQRPPSSSGSSSSSGPNFGMGADDIPLGNMPPRPNNPTPGSSFSDDLDLPIQRPPSTASSSSDDLDLPIQRPPSSSGSSTGSASDDLDLPIQHPPGSSGSSSSGSSFSLPIQGAPGPIGQYFQNMGNGIRNDIPGAIGAGTAFGGTIYAPGATAGSWSGTVHGNPLVGNTNPDPNAPMASG
ncbi:hypothetical protein AB0H77_29530 [Streptomyces sp. NPDC050844]|uniref:hypothetical protein n=1 Tax=Streptomyces sp. NPDC050844 TaxID=3155790 RepID=UPI003400BAD4